MTKRTTGILWWKLLAAILPVVVVVVALIVVIQYSLARSEMLRAIQRQVSLHSERTAEAIDGLLNHGRNELETLSESPLIVDYNQNVEFGLLAEAETHRRALCGYLLAFSRRAGTYAEILYLDGRGRAVCDVRGDALAAPSASHSAGAAFEGARATGRGRVWDSGVWRPHASGPVLYLAKPVHDQLGDFKGALVMAYSLGGAARLFEQIRGGSPAAAYLEGDGGRFPADARGFEGPAVSARRPLAAQAWTLVVEAPLDAYLGPVRHVRDAGVGAAAAGLALLCGTIWIVVRSLTRPIGILVAAARRIGAGELGHRIADPGTGELGAVATAFNDMAERLEANRKLNIELQSQLIQAEKLSAIGTLISAVAHELTNPLNIALNSAQLAIGEGTADGVREDLRLVLSSVERMKKVVQNLLFYSRQSKHERKRLDLNEAAGSALDLLSYRLKKIEDVVLEKSLATELPEVIGDFQQLVQVLFNLINNSCDAMEGRRVKRLAIRTGTCPEGVFLEVADTGVGIPAEAREKVFEPFFTTKEPGRGTGLGLTICREIVDRHRGRISFETVEGKGARFRIALPLADAEAPEDGGFAVETPAVPGKRILVVDDERELADLMARLLRVDGDEVTVVHHGSAAARLIREESFDLVVADMEMEETKGQQLFEELSAKVPDPARKILFVTGDLLNPRVLTFLTSKRCSYVGKPFDADELRQAVRKMLLGLPVRSED